MVPNEVRIPTISGPIALNAQMVNIKTSDRRKIAFVNNRGS